MKAVALTVTLLLFAMVVFGMLWSAEYIKRTDAEKELRELSVRYGGYVQLKQEHDALSHFALAACSYGDIIHLATEQPSELAHRPDFSGFRRHTKDFLAQLPDKSFLTMREIEARLEETCSQKRYRELIVGHREYHLMDSAVKKELARRF